MKLIFVAILTVFVIYGVSAQDGTMMKADKPAADGTMMKAEPMMDRSAYDLKGLGMQVVAFTTEAAAQALAKNSTVVYYFAATWCPTCQAMHADLKKNFDKIPKTVTLIYVNYDKSAELKKKYGVSTQHTFVTLGAMGEKKRVWNGSPTVAEFLKNALMM